MHRSDIWTEGNAQWFLFIWRFGQFSEALVSLLIDPVFLSWSGPRYFNWEPFKVDWSKKANGWFAVVFALLSISSFVPLKLRINHALFNHNTAAISSRTLILNTIHSCSFIDLVLIHCSYAESLVLDSWLLWNWYFQLSSFTIFVAVLL